MPLNIPGLSLSILRQDTVTQAGRPLLISGRFTAFGFGIPAFIRVFLEGPSYDPQVRTFDTNSSPFSGDYGVNVLAEKQGSYIVYAQAFPPPPFPVGPPFPEAILLLPPISESPRPPIAVGTPTPEGVSALTPEGLVSIPRPALSPVEFRPVITVAPGISITVPGAPTAAPVVGYPGYPPPTAPPPTPAAAPAPAVRKQARIEDILFTPNSIIPGQRAVGAMTWTNTGPAAATFDIALYLRDPRGVRYGPLQTNMEVRAAPNVPVTTTVGMPTAGLPAQVYAAEAEIYDPQTGEIIARQIFPQRLQFVAPGVPAPPAPVVPAPPAPVVPAPPPAAPPPSAPSITGVTFSPSQVTRGQTSTGTFSFRNPSTGWARWLLTVEVLDSARRVVSTPLSRYSLNVPPREAVFGGAGSMTFSLDTTPLEGQYRVQASLVDPSTGQTLASWRSPTALLSVLAAAAPVPAPAPAPPAAPPTFPPTATSEMFGMPLWDMAAPAQWIQTTPPWSVQLNQGEMWSGRVLLYTSRTPEMDIAWWQGYRPMPSYPLRVYIELLDPNGRKWPVVDQSRTFTPADDIAVPFSLDTAQVAPGTSEVWMLVTSAGTVIYWQRFGTLEVLPRAAVPTVGIPLWEGARPSQVGEPLSGSLSFANVGPAGYTFLVSVGLLDSGGRLYSIVDRQAVTFGRPDAIVRVSYDTSSLSPGAYSLRIEVADALTGARVTSQDIPFMTLVAAPAPPTPGPVPPVGEWTLRISQASTLPELEAIRAEVEAAYLSGQIDQAWYTSLYNLYLDRYYALSAAPPEVLSVPEVPALPTLPAGLNVTLTYSVWGLGAIAALPGMESIAQFVLDRRGIPADVIDVWGEGWDTMKITVRPRVPLPSADIESALPEIASAIQGAAPVA